MWGEIMILFNFWDGEYCGGMSVEFSCSLV